MLFSLDEKGLEVSSGECKATVDKEYLTVYQNFGAVLAFHLRNIMDVDSRDYSLTLTLSSKEKLRLSELGHVFEDFLRSLTDMRNEVIIKDLLMNESVAWPDVEMEYINLDDQGNQRGSGPGKIRLYETSLIVIPLSGEVFRLPYSDIAKVSIEEYRARINTEFGEQLLVSKMGSEFHPFMKALSDANSKLQNIAVANLKTLLPSIGPVPMRQLAVIMREGRAAKRSDIESIDPMIWDELEKRVSSSGLGETYDFLKQLARKEKICIGFKRGLMGELTGDYLWFLMPIYGANGEPMGNAVAMEASGNEESGKATYFYRIVSRREYRNEKMMEELDSRMDELIRKINRCMIDINFRREPIYLREEQLDEPGYSKYKIAVQKIPSLRILRDLFIGRVFHTSTEQWKSDVADLLKFNVKEQDDSAKWRKNS